VIVSPGVLGTPDVEVRSTEIGGSPRFLLPDVGNGHAEHLGDEPPAVDVRRAGPFDRQILVENRLQLLPPLVLIGATEKGGNPESIVGRHDGGLAPASESSGSSVTSSLEAFEELAASASDSSEPSSTSASF